MRVVRLSRRGVAALALPALLVTFAQPPVGAAAASGLFAAASGPSRPIEPWSLGLNGANMAGPAFSDPGFAAALTTFRPGTLRYPGGTVANFFDWRTGWYRTASKRWPGQPSVQTDMRLETFASAIRATGAVPVFDLNLVTWNGRIATDADDAAMLTDQLALLNAAQALGLPVLRVELGNELYLNGPSSPSTAYRQRFPTAQGYAQTANRWAAAIHDRFPAAQVAAVATEANAVPNLSQRRATWNDGLLPALTEVDAVTIHENMRVSTTSADVLLAKPQQQLTAVRTHELAELPAGLQVWVTEFNLADQNGRWFGTWAHGLFVAELAVSLLTTPGIGQAALHNVVGGTESAALFTGTAGFGATGPATVRFGRTACGTALAIVQSAVRTATSAQALAFAGGPVLAPSGVPGLVGVRLTGPSGTSLVVVNLTALASTIDVTSVLGAASATRSTISRALTERLTGTPVLPTTAQVPTGAVPVAAYSLNVLIPQV